LKVVERTVNIDVEESLVVLKRIVSKVATHR
jgi:hypothetical protein